MKNLTIMFSDWLKRRRKKKALKLMLKAKLYLRKAEVCSQSVPLCKFMYEAEDLLLKHSAYITKATKAVNKASYLNNLSR